MIGSSMPSTGAAIGILATGVLAVSGAAAASDTITIDPSSVLGVGGTTFGGWLVFLAHKFLNRMVKSMELRDELTEMQVEEIKAQRIDREKTIQHRQREREFWSSMSSQWESIDALLRMEHGTTLQHPRNIPRAPSNPIDLAGG